MIGAIAGDIVGSVYEFDRIKTTEFPLFKDGCDYTDDSVLTIATASSLLENTGYAESYRSFAEKYPDAGYGNYFMLWTLFDDSEPYNSWGNGSAMRVSPVGFALNTVEEVLQEAKRSAEVTHNHPEGIKGAQATALAIFLARKGGSKDNIREEITQRFGYNLDRSLDDIRPDYDFDESCQGTVPEAIISFLESDSVEHAIRLAVSLGGDSDTLACITGGIAEAYYGEVPSDITETVVKYLPDEFLDIMERFRTRYAD